MGITRLNHASIVAHDLEESVEFYTEVLGLESLPTPDFEVPVAWLSCSDGQLHLFEREVSPPEYHHIGLTVDDFEAVFQAATNDNLFSSWDDESDAPLYVLPDDAVQLYLNDPAGNLIEINWPDVDTLDPDLKAEIVDRNDLREQSGEASRATLNLKVLDHWTQ